MAQDLLDGTIWGDFAVIARLEATVVVLWGGEHFAPVRHRTIKDTIKNCAHHHQHRRTRIRVTHPVAQPQGGIHLLF